MDVTLGYLKDAIAFSTVVLFITIINVGNIKLTPTIIKYCFYAILFLIFTIDGIFTFIPMLHNYPLKKIITL
jgi:hypothetical protein